MTPNPIRKVLSTLANHRVQHLLMGGQACVLYGGAEFSRDIDIALLADLDNLQNLDAALADLDARVIAVPAYEREFLIKGHAVHFRCHHPEADRIRLDVMSTLRGVDPFPQLWERRNSIALEDGLSIEVLSLPDLIRAKKTQRDKDWPMIRRLVEAHYAQFRANPTPEQIEFWLREAQSPGLLLDLARAYPARIMKSTRLRPLLAAASAGDEPGLVAQLETEEKLEREQDRAYWQPLKKELETMRAKLRKGEP